MTKEIILAFHEDQLKHYRGKEGVRDESLLESALAQPEASFEGDYVHTDIYHMAAAYGYHICQNHPFFDGNKRTALIAMYTFLFVNGYRIVAEKKILFAIIMDLANGKVSKDELSEFLKTHSEKR